MEEQNDFVTVSISGTANAIATLMLQFASCIDSLKTTSHPASVLGAQGGEEEKS